MVLLFIGTSGSGKDTQAELVAEKYDFDIISTGELFRQRATIDDDLGHNIKEMINSGIFPEDDLVYQILDEHLAKINKSNIIFTGVVRRATQIAHLDRSLEKKGLKLDNVVIFDLSDEEAVKRLSNRWVCPKDKENYHTVFKKPNIEGICDMCGTELIQREDDKLNAITKRLEEFNKAAKDIISEYEKRNILIRIDAIKSIKDIHQELLIKLGLK